MQTRLRDLGANKSLLKGALCTPDRGPTSRTVNVLIASWWWQEWFYGIVRVPLHGGVWGYVFLRRTWGSQVAMWGHPAELWAFKWCNMGSLRPWPSHIFVGRQSQRQVLIVLLQTNQGKFDRMWEVTFWKTSNLCFPLFDKRGHHAGDLSSSRQRLIIFKKMPISIELITLQV